MVKCQETVSFSSSSYFRPLFRTQPLIYGRGPTPAGMAMTPMLLPDGRIGYVLQQPGAHPYSPPPPQHKSGGNRSGGSGSSGGGSRSGGGSSNGGKRGGDSGRRYNPY